MPTISQFFGIIIHMYIRGEHNPPHFHALYAEFEALIDIQTLAARVARVGWVERERNPLSTATMPQPS